MQGFANFELELLIHYAVLSGEEFTKSKLGIRAANREIAAALVEPGLLDCRKKGSAMYLRANDSSWRWAEENLGSEFRSRSKAAFAVLDLLRRKVSNFAALTETRLADLLDPRPAGSQSIEPSPADSLYSLITQACLDSTGGQYDVRLRLRDLRDRLGDLSRERQDEALLAMQRDGLLALMAIDDPRDRTEADDEAALFIGGHRRDAIYLRRERI